MTLDLSSKEFRRLLDLVYIGNWVLNSIRGDDRFKDYDNLESKIFEKCRDVGMDSLLEEEDGVIYPSSAYCEGGIHEAIMTYEDTVFYEILSEELTRRDFGGDPVTEENYDEFSSRMEEYITEFEVNGIDNIQLDI